MKKKRLYIHGSKRPPDDRNVEDDCDFVCGRSDRAAWAQPGFHPAQVVAHGGRTVVEGRSGQTEQVARTVFDSSHTSPERFTTANVIVRAKIKPGVRDIEVRA